MVTVKDRFNKARLYFDQVRSEIHGHDGLTTYVTGGIAIGNDFDTYLAADLTRAETTSIPVSLILLLIVFGTLVAALLPVGVGAAAVVGGVAGTLLLARFTDVSTYALNIVTLVGLGVAIDYSLFIVNRYREELEAGATTEPLVDVERMHEMMGDEAELSGMVNLYLDQMCRNLSQLDSAVAARNHEEVELIAHNCAGTSANCGMTAVAIPFRELEDAGRTAPGRVPR